MPLTGYLEIDDIDGESIRKDSGDAHLDYLTITMTNATDTFDFKATDEVEPVGMLLPAVQAAREAAREAAHDGNDLLIVNNGDGSDFMGDANLDGVFEASDFLMLG